MRFLSVCQWKVDKAAQMLSKDYEWRKRAKPRGIRAATVAKCGGWEALQRRTAILQMPCMAVRTKEWKPGSFSLLRGRCVEQNDRHIAYRMEQMVRRMPKQHGVWGAVMLLDMKGFPMSLLIPYVRNGVTLCQSHYPCRLGAIVAYNLPSYFSIIWNVAKPWFNEDIRSKIVFAPHRLNSEAEVLDWLDERERKREKPFKLAFTRLAEGGA